MVISLGHAASSATGLVGKFNVAIVEPRVLFPAGVEFFPFSHIASPVTAVGGGHDACTMTNIDGNNWVITVISLW